MAAIMNRTFKSKNKQNKISCDFIFDGGLQSSTRALMVIELVKYFMYERQQIPLPFEHAKRDLKLRCEREIESSRIENKKMPLRKTLKNRLIEKKANTAIDNLETMFDNICKSFTVCPEINQIMIILGGTIISPKETYQINMPPLSPDAENLTFKSCVKALFRQLITQDLLGDIKAIAPTNMSILLRAPRDCTIDWFTPNHNFKTRRLGKQFIFNCLCKQPVVINHDLTHDGTELEISGIDCLDSIDIDMAEVMLEDVSLSELLSQRISFGNHRRSTNVHHVERMEQDEDTPSSVFDRQEDLIWFQSPVIVKGYRDPGQKKL